MSAQMQAHRTQTAESSILGYSRKGIATDVVQSVFSAVV